MGGIHKVEDGSSTSFWHEVWSGGTPLSSTFPRVYRLESDKSCSVHYRVSCDVWSLVRH